MKTTFSLVLAVVCVIATMGCATKRPTGPIVYNRYNIHVIDAFDRAGHRWVKASYTGWIGPTAGHRIIPVNTPMVLGGADVVHRQPGFWLYLADGTDVFFEYDVRNMRRTYQDYAYSILSSGYTDHNNLSKIDQQGICEGKALIGMSRQGVLAALGIPALHNTPTLDQNRWVYWRHRNSRRVGVWFDANGLVSKVR